jgi:hypothetical protein
LNQTKSSISPKIYICKMKRALLFVLGREMAGGGAEAGLSADFFGRCVVESRSDVEPGE